MVSLRRAAANLALLFAALAVAAVAFELSLRRLAPQRSEHERMFRHDPRLGWRFEADRRGAVVYPGGAHFVRTNAHGFRDAPFDAIDPAARRLLVLGDSFVSNVSVADDEVFTEVLEHALPGVSVLNLGVNGYGQVQELLLLETALEELAPDAVLVVVYLRNDLTDNLGIRWIRGFTSPAAHLDPARGVLSIRPPPRAPPPPVQEPWHERLHATHFLRARIAALRHRFARAGAPGGAAATDREDAAPPRPAAATRKPPGAPAPSRFTPPELYLCRTTLAPETERLYRTAGVLLVELDARARRAGVELAFALAPSLAQVRPAVFERIASEHGADAADYDLELPGRRLREDAQARGLLVLDLLPALRAADARGEVPYSIVDQHWTASGNRSVAAALADFAARTPALREALALGEPG